MKIIKNKIFAVTIALLFILSMTASITLIPDAGAHSPPLNFPTWAYVNVAPNPIGVGQTTNVVMWVDKVPPTTSSTGATGGDFGDVLYNFTLTVTKPDRTTQSFGPYASSYSAGYVYDFTPTTIGNYTFVFHFGGCTILGLNPPPTGFSASTLLFH